MITEILKKNVYNLLEKFVKAVNERNQEELRNNFFVDSEVFEKMLENLEGFFGEKFTIGIAPSAKIGRASCRERV